MIALIAAVFVASLLGSLHCAGMCGAFVAFAVADAEVQTKRLAARSAAYHGGRLLTYTALGVAAGSVGALLDMGGALAGVSRVAMALAGAVMVLFGISALVSAMGKRPLRAPAPRFMHRLMAAGHRAAMSLGPLRRAFVIGLLTTLLPCGWLYAFAAVAAGTASPLLGGLTMSVFWLGTLPVLVSLGAGVQRLTGLLGRRLPHATALMLIIIGLWALAGRGALDAVAIAARQPNVQGVTESRKALGQSGESTPACCEAKP